MAIVLGADKATIVKFQSSGLIALCQEVSEYITEYVDSYHLDPTTARYEWDAENREHHIVLDVLKVE